MAASVALRNMAVPIRPELSLALNIVSSPGAYALLLGSGVSRSAQIPTGWEIVLDLVRQIAENEGDDPGSDPSEWYLTKFEESPRYASMLEELAPSPTERQAMLRRYFEATPDEREEGIKTPTEAHTAIARLVRDGWVRVIVTTNFDRLLETSLDVVGVTPIVISTADQALGAPPMAHSVCTVVKVHGDYLDTRIRNSDDELHTYEDEMNAVLDEILDQYGLVVCGWSAEHDTALRSAIERCRSRRYTMYWCSRSAPVPVAQGLIDRQDARIVEIEDADSFFVGLEESVTGVHQTDQRHPQEARAIVESLKRYIPDATSRIRLRELVRDVVEDRIASLRAGAFPVDVADSNEELVTRVEKLYSMSEAPMMLAINGCYWGEPHHDDVWLALVRRLAEVEPSGSSRGSTSLFHLPALLVMYAAGMAAIAAHRYDLLKSILQMPTYSTRHSGQREAVISIYLHDILPESVGHVLFPHPEAPKRKYHTPSSQFLCRSLRPLFDAIIPSDWDYWDAFDRYEYMASLVHADAYAMQGRGMVFPGGCFFWRTTRAGRWLPQIVAEEIEETGDRWPPFLGGLFDGDPERLSVVKQHVDETAERHRYW